MVQPPMNMLAVLGAALAKVVIGAVWYSPALFVKQWSKLSGVTQAKMRQGMGKAIVVDVVGSFLTAFVLAHAIFYAGARTPRLGMAVGFLNWLGFVAFVHLGSVTYEKKPFKLFLINTGYLLVSLVVMGGILSVYGLRWT